jgi:hypothetical protein
MADSPADSESTPVDIVVSDMQCVLLILGMLQVAIARLQQSVITLDLRARGGHE